MSVQVDIDKERCPYDPQQMPFPEIIEKLINAVEVAHGATHSVGAYLDLLYWRGVALARDAHVHSPCQSGAIVKRKMGVSPAPFIDDCLRSQLAIEDDRERVVARVFFISDDKGSGAWCLQLEGEQGRIFSEDQFDLVSCGAN